MRMVPWKSVAAASATAALLFVSFAWLASMRENAEAVRVVDERARASRMRVAAAYASASAIAAAAERQNAAERAAQKAADGDAVGAWVYAQIFVKRALKSPGSADFGGLFSEYQNPTSHCKQLGDRNWRCSGWVDAQNAFGAKLRADWAMTLKPRPDGGWTAVEGPTLTER